MKNLKLVTLALVLFSLSSCNCCDYTMEYAYFEGQRDALTGDIRIKLNHDSCWIWKKSPWNNGEAPIYDPSFNCK